MNAYNDMESALVIGRDGQIGKALNCALEKHGITTYSTSRRAGTPNGEYFDLMLPTDDVLPVADVTYFCAARTRFIDCESDPTSWWVNVDAPLVVARRSKWFVYLSSDAVERALHTAYGMQKAFAELSLGNLPNVSIVRISKIDAGNISALCANLILAGNIRRPGLTRLV